MSVFLTAIIGLILGSFYSVCASRYGTATTIFSPARSHCPQCDHQLAIYENIPIISYLIQRGQCKHCKARIPIFYPLIELTSMTWALLAAQQATSIYEWLILMIIGGICIVASAIDFRTFLLPNILTYSGAIIVLGASFFQLLPINVIDSLLGAVFGALLLWLAAVLFKLARNIEGLGFGDVKFMVMLGGLIGWKGLSWLILCASGTALFFAIFYLHGKKDATQTPIPFGPFLALGTCITFLYQAKLEHLFY